MTPVIIEGKAEQDQAKADGGAAGILEEDADGEGERAENEDSRDDRIARAAVRTIHLWFGFAKAEKGDNREAVENPRREDEEVREFFECSGEGHEARENALKNESAAGS